MVRKRTDGTETRRRLLETACDIFAEKGYRNATIAEICDRAQANIAAVNYHFGDKETLYGTALRHAYEAAARCYPIDGGLPASAPAARRLRAHVEAHLRRTFSDGEASDFPRLIVKELAEPTPALSQVVRDVLQPHRDHLRGVLRELLGDAVPGDMLRLCVVSIISQCYFFGFNRAIRQRHFDAGRVTDEHLQGLIDHITNFCLSGIRDVRARLAGREADSAPSASTGSGSAPQPATARHEKNLPHRAKGISN
jgi:AcrR family transcriptional regulator